MLNGNFLERRKKTSSAFRKVVAVFGIFIFIISPLSFNFKAIEFTEAATNVNYEYINTDTVWTSAGSPYVVNSTLYINANLSIAPGVIVKFEQGSLIVNGSLTAIGDDDDQIIFTSVNDDGAGGKTVPWSTGNPLSGDWGAINVHGGRAVLDNVEIRYGGQACAYEIGVEPIRLSVANAGWCYDTAVLSGYGDISISNSEIHHNKIGIEFYDGSIEISGSKIYENQGYGLTNFSEKQISAVDNWWGDDSGPYHETFNAEGKGDWIYGDVLFDPWVGKVVTPKRNPVILVPGFFGSWKVNNKMELDPILHVYDNLWEALKLAGYEENKSLFAFPYNWRQSNATTSLLLKNRIDEVAAICSSAGLVDYDCEKVDLVAHSMGGIVSRAYIETNKYEDDVDQLIFLATPHRGSPKAYLSWEGGESGNTIPDTVIERIVFTEAYERGFPNNFFYIKDSPMLSAKELLPTFNYLRDKGEDSLRTYFFDYPRNEFLEEFNYPHNLARLQKVKVLNIVADAGATSTINAFRVVDEDYADGRWEHGYPENYHRLFSDHGLEYGPGDNTVPAISNRDFNGFDEVLIGNSNHLKVVSDAQDYVIEELTGSRPQQGVKKNFLEKMLLVRIFSPADFVIIAPDGKRLGKDFVDNRNINEIEGAFYSGFDGREEFATILDPIDGEYMIKLLGTDNGEYRLSVSALGEATSTDKDFVGQIASDQERNFIINYSGSATTLIGALEPQDVTPPSLVMNFPLEGDVYKHNQKMSIDYSASDDFSGLSTVEIRMDDQMISSSAVDLFNFSLGTHNLLLIARDRAGNYIEKRVEFFVEADIKSSISDIEEVYRRGWLSGLSRKNILVGELKVLEGALALLEKTKEEIAKRIEEVRNNPLLNKKTKETLIAGLNKKLAELEQSRPKIIQLNLKIFETTLNQIKNSNYLKQTGYDIIKNNMEYLKNNL